MFDELVFVECETAAFETPEDEDALVEFPLGAGRAAAGGGSNAGGAGGGCNLPFGLGSLVARKPRAAKQKVAETLEPQEKLTRWPHNRANRAFQF